MVRGHLAMLRNSGTSGGPLLEWHTPEVRKLKRLGGALMEWHTTISLIKKGLLCNGEHLIVIGNLSLTKLQFEKNTVYIFEYMCINKHTAIMVW